MDEIRDQMEVAEEIETAIAQPLGEVFDDVSSATCSLFRMVINTSPLVLHRMSLKQSLLNWRKKPSTNTSWRPLHQPSHPTNKPRYHPISVGGTAIQLDVKLILLPV